MRHLSESLMEEQKIINESAKAYRLKHIPTGWYYKSGNLNLSLQGKIYLNRKPSISAICMTEGLKISDAQMKEFQKAGIKLDIKDAPSLHRSVSVTHYIKIEPGDFEIEEMEVEI